LHAQLLTIDFYAFAYTMAGGEHRSCFRVVRLDVRASGRRPLTPIPRDAVSLRSVEGFHAL